MVRLNKSKEEIVMEIKIALIALLGVVLSVFVTWFNGKKSIEANLVSAARIEWIQSVRTEMAYYLNKSRNAYNHLSTAESRKNNKKIIRELLVEIERTQYWLLLNFSISDEHQKIRKEIIDVACWLNDIQNREFEHGEKTSDKPITDLLETSTNYFKKEWDKARKGK